MSETKDDFMRWARAALEYYPLASPELCYLGHSDNLTYQVEEAGGVSYLLRLHYPAISYYRGIRQLPEVIASELSWLEALASEGGFSVQKPVHTRSGELMTMVSIEEGKTIPCTLLEWKEGQHFSPAFPSAEDQVERFGSLVGRLHAFSSQWSPPPGFIRPGYDNDHFRRNFARLLRGVDLGIFSETAFRTLRATGQLILVEIERLPDSPEHWGMIHADLHVGNFLVNGEEIIPIDFSFCGFGHYLFDLSVCLAGGLNAALRPAFLRGYRTERPLPEDSLRPMEAYALAGRLGYYAYQIDNPTEREWLQRRIPQVVEGVCTRFLRGEEVFTAL